MFMWSVQAGDIAGKLQREELKAGDILVITYGPTKIEGIWPTSYEVECMTEIFEKALKGTDIDVLTIPNFSTITVWNQEHLERFREKLRKHKII